MTKAEAVRERVDALVDGGMRKAEAFRQLSEELGQPVKSLQGSYYTAARKANGGKGTSRPRETTPTDAIEGAKAVLIKAIEQIDAEIGTAKARAEEARAEFEALKASATERKMAIKAKLDTLSA